MIDYIIKLVSIFAVICLGFLRYIILCTPDKNGHFKKLKQYNCYLIIYIGCNGVVKIIYMPTPITHEIFIENMLEIMLINIILLSMSLCYTKTTTNIIKTIMKTIISAIKEMKYYILL